MAEQPEHNDISNKLHFTACISHPQSNNTQPAATFRRILFAIITCSLISLADGYDGQSLPVVIPALARDWGISAALFGKALSAGAVGSIISMALVAPLGDQLGRKRVLVLSMIVVIVGMLGAAASQSMWMLVASRIVIGFGLGVCLPNLFAITLELAPVEWRALTMGIVHSLMGIGAFLTGIAAPLIIPRFGSPGVLLMGAALSTLVVLLAVMFLPGTDRGPMQPSARERTDCAASGRIGLTQLLTPQVRTQTLLLWCGYLSFACAFYGLTGWLPTIMARTGISEAVALRNAAMVWPGAILGNILVGMGYDRYRNAGPLAALSTAGVIMLLLFPLVGRSGSAAFPWMLAVLGVALGSQVSMLSPIAAIIYPRSLLSSGIGWSMGIGRIGALLGPLIGAAILSIAVAPEFILVFFAAPLALSTLLLCLTLYRANRSAD